jgi:hypothetical protein
MNISLNISVFFLQVWPFYFPEMDSLSIRNCFRDFEARCLPRLVLYGDRNMRLYEELLADKNISSVEKQAILWIACRISTRSSIICKFSLDALSRSDSEVTTQAYLLITHYRCMDARSAAIASLFDNEIAVALTALRYLAVVGDEDSLRSINILLNSKAADSKNFQSRSFQKEVERTMLAIRIRVSSGKEKGTP